MFAHEYGWSYDEILDMPISRLAKLSEAIKKRNDASFVRENIIIEWATKVIASTVAGGVQDESGKYVKAVSKIRLPWDSFGFPEMVGKKSEEELGDPNDLSYLETGDLSAAEKNAGKQLPRFS